MNSINLELVKYIPKQLSQGVLYVSLEYSVAAHLCACGCGNKVTTPLGSAEWTFTQKNGVPTLFPSIGSWQLACKSHYFIRAGKIVWSGQLSDQEIRAGRSAEQRRRVSYYETRSKKKIGFWNRVKEFTKKVFG